MLVKYEDVKFKVGFEASIERHLIKQAIKKVIGRWIGKPYKSDFYLEYAAQLLSTVKAPVVVDVGANIGTTVLPLAVKFPKAKFYAIEPHPLPASRFIKNCELNQINNVTLISTAIGSDDKLAQIYSCPNNSGGHRLTGFKGREDIEKLAKASFEPIIVPVKSLNSILSNFEIEHCDLLKIDTEGYEFFVLESLGDRLHPNSIKYIITEYGPEALRKIGKSGWDLVSLALKKGYKCKVLGTDKMIETEQDIPIMPDFTVIDFLFFKG